MVTIVHDIAPLTRHIWHVCACSTCLFQNRTTSINTYGYCTFIHTFAQMLLSPDRAPKPRHLMLPTKPPSSLLNLDWSCCMVSPVNLYMNEGLSFTFLSASMEYCLLHGSHQRHLWFVFKYIYFFFIFVNLLNYKWLELSLGSTSESVLQYSPNQFRLFLTPFPSFMKSSLRE